jgi:tetratricopeptide (TPR) repeat protein
MKKSKWEKQEPADLPIWKRFTVLPEKYVTPLLAVTLIVALIVRMAALLSLHNSLYSNFLLPDEQVYQNWALAILYKKPFLVYDFSFLPAYIMAFVYRVSAIDIYYIRILNVIFGVLTCWLIYKIGEELAGRTIGLYSCMIASLYKPFIFFSITLLKESLVLFLFAATIYLLLALMNRYSAMRIFCIGSVGAFLINVRANAVVLIPVILLLILWDIWNNKILKNRQAFMALVTFILGFAFASTPFIAYNYTTSHSLTATPVGGFNLYIANNLQNPDPYYRPVPFATSAPSEQAIHFVIEASRREGKRLSLGESSNYWTQQVIKIALEHPAAILWRICQKTLTLFNQFEAEDNYHIGFMSNFITFLKLPFFSYWFIFPFGIAGMVLHTLQSKKNLALSLISAAYALTLIIFYTNARIRIPLLVILIPFAVLGLIRTIGYWKEKRGKATSLYATIIFSFLVIEFLPVQGTGDMTAYYNLHAINLVSKGLENEAIDYWKMSSNMDKPYSAYANLSLARRYYQKGMIAEGDAYLNKVPDSSFAVASKYKLLGDTLKDRGQIDGAIQSYKKSLAINSGQVIARGELIKLYRINNQDKALQEEKELQYILSFYSH